MKNELKIKPKYKIGDVVCVILNFSKQISNFPKEGHFFQVVITIAYFENNMWKYMAKTDYLNTEIKNLTEETIYEL